MSWHDEREYWNGGDKYAWFGFGMDAINRSGKHRMQFEILPVHVDRPTGGATSATNALPEGTCDGDGQEGTDD